MKEDLNHIALVGPGGRKKIIDELIAQSDAITQLNESAVTPNNDGLTEQEQMQVRKNLGLYYEETAVGEKTAQYNNEPESATLSGYAKISDDTPAKEDIISFGDVQHVIPQDFDDGYLIVGIGVMLPTAYRVVLNNSLGNEPGIYWNISGTNNYPLKYKGETTVVSKIDEKYLPEQESGSVLPWLDLTGGLDIPSDGDNIDLSSMISQADWEKLLAGEYAGIYTPENIGSLVSDLHRSLLKATKGLTGWGTVAKYCAFSDPVVILSGGNPDLVQQITLFIVGNNINNVSIRRISIPTTVPGPVTLSALPTASMTTQAELDAIGLTNDVIVGLYSGNYTGIKYSDTSVIMMSKFAFAQIKTVQKELSSGNIYTTLSFDLLGNNYTISITSVVGGSTTVTVTVTPLS